MAKMLYAPDEAAVGDRCYGQPNWAGGCPGSLPGAPVACAGRRIVVRCPGGVQLELTVAPDAKSCPLAALATWTVWPTRGKSRGLRALPGGGVTEVSMAQLFG